MAASKEKSFQILDEYFSETPDEQIAKDMEEYCPELGSEVVPTMPHDEGSWEMLLPDDPKPEEVTRPLSRWRRFVHL